MITDLPHRIRLFARLDVSLLGWVAGSHAETGFGKVGVVSIEGLTNFLTPLCIACSLSSYHHRSEIHSPVGRHRSAA